MENTSGMIPYTKYYNFDIFLHCSFTAGLKTWLPFLIVCLIVGVIVGCSVGVTR